MAQTNLLWSQSLIYQDQIAPSLTANTTAPAVTKQFTPVTAGVGSWGQLHIISGSVAAQSGDNTSSVYKFVRLHPAAKVKWVRVSSGVAAAGNADINVAFSDSIYDGTLPSNQGTIPQLSSANNKLFGAATSLVALTWPTDITFGNATNFPIGVAKSAPGPSVSGSPGTLFESTNTPLWVMLGLTTQPAGFFDIQMNITTTITTGGTIYLECGFVI